MSERWNDLLYYSVLTFVVLVALFAIGFAILAFRVYRDQRESQKRIEERLRRTRRHL